MGRVLVRRLGTVRARFNGVALSVTVANSMNVNVTRRFRLPFMRRIITTAGFVGAHRPTTSTVVSVNNRSTGVVFLRGNRMASLQVGNGYTNNANTFVSRVTVLLGMAPRRLNGLTSSSAHVCPVTSHYKMFDGASVRGLVSQGVPSRSVTTSVFRTMTMRAVSALTRKRSVGTPVMIYNNPFSFVPTLHRTFSGCLGVPTSDVVLPRGTGLVPT